MTNKPISAASAATRVAACGPAATNAQAKYENDLQENVIKVAFKSAPSTEQYDCIANVSYDTGYYVDFDPPFREKYWSIYNNLERSRNAAEARERLQKRGVLNRVLQFDGHNLSAVAENVELICGIKRRSVLIVSGDDVALHTDRFISPSSDSDFLCVMDGMLVAGVQMGFVGNEAISVSDTGPSPSKP
ncbi:MAG TPA: hypothetical protein VF509_04360 [Sphingobium sp.]